MWRPTNPPKEWAHVNFWKLGDSDILINYSNNNYPQVKSETIAFFSGQKFKSPEAAFGVPPGAIHPDPILGYSAKLPNGKIISPNTASACSRGLGAQIRVYDSQNNILITKTLLLILQNPRLAPPVICEGTTRPGFPQRLVVFEPNQVVPLSDNTFLASDLVTGTVVRLDENLNTKSFLLGKYLFMVDPSGLETRVRKYYRGAPEYGVDWVKFYEDLCIEMINEANRKS